MGGKGQPEAEYDLGLLYAKGLGVQRDLQVAQQWYEAAALQGNAQAEYSLGQMYAQGWGISDNDASAMRWMQMANGNNGDNQDDLGWMPIEGYGRPPITLRPPIGIGWRRIRVTLKLNTIWRGCTRMVKASQGRDAGVQAGADVCRARLRSCGSGLGWRYANGRGVEKDESQAFFW